MESAVSTAASMLIVSSTDSLRITAPSFCVRRCGLPFSIVSAAAMSAASFLSFGMNLSVMVISRAVFGATLPNRYKNLSLVMTC